MPTVEILNIECEKRSDINQETFQTVVSALSEFDTDRSNEEWLTDVTEKWCRDRAIYLALVESIGIADGNNEKKNIDAIPSILSDALGKFRQSRWS